MASWIVHLRLAEQLFQTFHYLDKTAFYLGNIAIDSGKVNEDQTIVPPVSISHWTPTGKRNQCRYQDFFNTYCLEKNDNFKFSFYLGCVCHLMTDNLWVDKIVLPTKKKFTQEFNEKQLFILEVKKDWYDLDFLYLKKHPTFEPLEILKTLHDFKNSYLPWFDEDAIQIKIDELIAFYQDVPANLERDYPYLNEKEMERFVVKGKVKITNEVIRLIAKDGIENE